MDCHLILGLIIIFIVAVALTMFSIAIKPLSQSEALFEGYYQDWLKYIKLLFKIICLFIAIVVIAILFVALIAVFVA